MGTISKVLIANRGEIAARVIRACRELGIDTVVAVSEADRDSLPARMADRAVCVGPAQSSQSYLNINVLLTAALHTGADAIHPGYGFLAERPELAIACQQNGIKFIGPSSQTLRDMGNKLMARQMVRDLGLPTIPGSQQVDDPQRAMDLSREIGFPLLLKAAAGGGGRGIVVVNDPAELPGLLDATSAEVMAAFGDGTLFLEKYIPNARHIEVQIVADQQGQVIHLGERDCSIQRRYQKVIEEAPSPAVSPQLRESICQAAVTIARNIGYEGAGTVEFVFDQDTGAFYFLEMNTRIQVEHPVSEMISGVDLVQEQLRIAAGEPLSLSQEQVRLTGHAIECRITAESAQNGFQPCPGRITRWEPPSGEHIRLDTHCYPGYLVPPYYDSLMAKLITWGDDRGQALERMRHALDDFQVSGVETTISFLSQVIKQNAFGQGQTNTRWLEEYLKAQKEPGE